ncbi:major facilitator superfamily transporter [Diplodia corticola]|uniref:Major facilitator superfamily transporter n=1 Tax=Diplodia corticola TaxID=236234 RepID=A0A1J9QTB6_9PEZI|nr:major facilitator superfamily transporter [Diplodia corticola]OJD32214.1 major facilitator superfamily transporter [Diplodia corticola]
MAQSAGEDAAKSVEEEGTSTPTQKDIGHINTAEVDDLAEPDDPNSTTRWPWERKNRKPVDLDAIATKRSVFDDPALAPFYMPRPDHENIHRFSIPFRWTYREEQAVRRKTDVRIFLWILVMFFALNIDRGNLSNAVADNLLDDISITTNDYNNAQNMYRVGFLVSEIPSQMLGKWLGPDRWIPCQIVLWSLASGGQFWMRDRAGFFACRFLLGLFMGGFIPDAVLYLSYFYTAAEMPMRLALFWFVDSMSGVAASFIAYGVLHMGGVRGREGWRWLFLVEAALSLAIGLLSFLFLVPGPTQTRTRWNPRGLFSAREERILVNRVLRDDPSKGDMHNRQPLSLAMLARSLRDVDLWPVYAIGLVFEIPATPPKAYLSLTLRDLGFDAFQTTLLGIPVTVYAALNMLLATWLSERLGQVALPGLLAQLWVLPLLVVEYARAGALSPWAQYAVLFFLLGQPSLHAAQVAWCSRLSGAVRTRAVGAALYNIAVQLSGIAASNIYRADDKPLYRRGNRDLIAITVGTVAAYAAAKAYYVWRNRGKRAKWEAMTKEEQQHYLATTGDMGNKRLDFMFES